MKNDAMFRIGRPLRFVLVGVLCTAIHAGSATALIMRGCGPGLANGTGFLLGAVVSYLLHSLWTFGLAPRPSTLGRFALSTALTSSLAALIAHLCSSGPLPPLFSTLVVVTVLPPITFAAHKRFTFRSDDRTPDMLSESGFSTSCPPPPKGGD